MHGKRVVVIGIGNSGGDIAVESSRVAEQVGKSFLRLTKDVDWKYFLCVDVSLLLLYRRCIWALVAVLGSSVRFLTTACQWTWSTTRALSTSCSSSFQWISSTGLVRRNLTPCMTTPCTPSNPHTGQCCGDHTSYFSAQRMTAVSIIRISSMLSALPLQTLQSDPRDQRWSAFKDPVWVGHYQTKCERDPWLHCGVWWWQRCGEGQSTLFPRKPSRIFFHFTI